MATSVVVGTPLVDVDAVAFTTAAFLGDLDLVKSQLAVLLLYS